MTEQNEQITPDAMAAAGDMPPAPEPPAGEHGQPVGGPSEAVESTKAREWLTQLQTMIDDLATQAAPTVRQVGAKAAELAAAAGEKAGPFAQRAAEITGEAGMKLAERSRHLAEELRRDLPGSAEGGAPSAGAAAEASAGEEPATPETPRDETGA